jgi:multiple sugar transport system substrate-binding protein
MIETPIAATRRQMLALGMLAAAGAVGAQAQPKITMLINQSPWFDGFKKVVERYEKDTGNRIELDVTPFGGMLEKTRNSLRASAGTYDLLALNAMWMNEVYGGGFLQALDDIEPGYRLPANVLDFDQSVYWNDAKKSFDPSGRLLGVPVNGNVQVLYFRRDLYKEKGLKEPTTWAELEANAKALHNPVAGVYGFGVRGDRGSATYDVSPFIYSHGGRIFKDERNGDYTVALSSAASLKGLETYLRLARDYGPPSPWAMSRSCHAASRAGMPARRVTGWPASPETCPPNANALPWPSSSGSCARTCRSPMYRPAPCPSSPGWAKRSSARTTATDSWRR